VLALNRTLWLNFAGRGKRRVRHFPKIRLPVSLDDRRGKSLKGG
jgi:hypothetical protein